MFRKLLPDITPIYLMSCHKTRTTSMNLMLWYAMLCYVTILMLKGCHIGNASQKMTVVANKNHYQDFKAHNIITSTLLPTKYIASLKVKYWESETCLEMHCHYSRWPYMCRAPQTLQARIFNFFENICATLWNYTPYAMFKKKNFCQDLRSKAYSAWLPFVDCERQEYHISQ